MADFYVALAGGQILWRNDGSVGLRLPDHLLVIAQRVPDYEPPPWPGSSVVHFDFAAGDDLTRAVQRAIALGATSAALQPDPRWQVLIDPAGHPFCITTITFTDQPRSP